jgi:SAM-dependent methyltransferase
VTEAQRERVQASFGGSAEAYVASPGHAGGADLDQILRWAERRAAARALDVATGGGHTALGIARFTPSVIATDLTLPMLAAARHHAAGAGAAGVRFLAADAAALPFRDESFGVVTCRLAAHHFPELLPALRQIARVLRRGGSFLVEDISAHDDDQPAGFMREVERRRDPSHVRAFRPAEWTAFLRAAGLTVIDEAAAEKVRPWDEWTERMRMTPQDRAALDAFVLAAPEACRAAFDFRVEAGRIQSFTTRLLLLRADKD